MAAGTTKTEGGEGVLGMGVKRVEGVMVRGVERMKGMGLRVGEVRVAEMTGVGIDPKASFVHKALLYNSLSAALGTIIAAAIKGEAALGFAVGYAIGVVNLTWLMSIAKRGALMPPEKASRFVAVRYYIRFLLTAAIFAALIYFKILNPWSPVIGLTASFFTAIGLLIILAKEEVL